MRSMETLKQLIRPFGKLGKCIMYHNFGRSYRSGKGFIRPLGFVRPWTHILIPVRIFFILERQMASSRESRRHVLEFLARTLLTCNLIFYY